MSTISHERFEAVIGLEVHAQLSTASKAFTPAPVQYGEAPNTLVTPVCLAHPGTLPVINENLVRYIIKMGLATSCSISPVSSFARKNYFYPDLPSGYQRSQAEPAICVNGYLDIDTGEYEKRIGITRIHMEEDAGKLIHDQDPYNSLVDLNRAGTCLIEIVSEPDIRTPQEAYAYLTKIKQIVQYLEICDGNMEEGSLRCDANVSVRPRGQKEFGTRAEIKNMNSFRNVERAIEHEIYRQIELIEGGGAVEQETRLWDAAKMETRAMRSKEDAQDYRYFPDPDLPPVTVSQELLDEIRQELPELADVRRKRFIKQYGLSEIDAVTITESRYLADYFEEVAAFAGNARAAANEVLGDVLRTLNEKSIEIDELTISPKRLAELITLKEEDKISSSAQTEIFNAMLGSTKTAEMLAKEMNLLQVSDTGFLEELVDTIIAGNPDEVQRFKDGKKQLMGFFVGEAMKASRGKANPKMITQLINKKLLD